MPVRVLIADDHRLMREGTAALLRADDRIEVAGMAADFEKFYKDGNKAAGTRVRLAMQELKTFAQTVRNEVQSIKNSEKA